MPSLVRLISTVQIRRSIETSKPAPPHQQLQCVGNGSTIYYQQKSKIWQDNEELLLVLFTRIEIKSGKLPDIIMNGPLSCQKLCRSNISVSDAISSALSLINTAKRERHSIKQSSKHEEKIWLKKKLYCWMAPTVVLKVFVSCLRFGVCKAVQSSAHPCGPLGPSGAGRKSLHRPRGREHYCAGPPFYPVPVHEQNKCMKLYTG